MNKTIIVGLSAIIVLSSCCDNSAKCENDSVAKCDTVCGKQSCSQATTDEIDGIKKALGYYTEAAVKGDSKIAMQGFAPAATMSYVVCRRRQSCDRTPRCNIRNCKL